MANVKKWWLETGLPWAKEYWWVCLLLPFLAIIAIGMFVMNRQVGAVVIEPLAAADERAKTEAETRARQLEVENTRLQGELAALQTKYNELESQMEQRLAARVEELRGDPDALNAAMRAAGRG